MTSCANDSNSIDLTISGGALTADLIVSPADGIIPNPLTVEPDGVYVIGADGWIPLPSTLAPTGGALGNISYYTTSVDLSSLITPGQRLKFTQNGTAHYFVVLVASSTQLTLFSIDGSTVDASAITLPAFSVGDTPAGQTSVGPLVVDTGSGDGVEHLYFSSGKWRSAAKLVWASANNAALTRVPNTYANMTAAGYISQMLGFKALLNTGITWQFRWKGGVSYGSGQTSAGIRLTAVPADIFGTGGVQDTTNVFAELTTFAANAERVQDSGWVDMNGAVTLKDLVSIMPQFKSDGTRTVTISQLDPFTVQGRLVIN